MTTTLPFRIRAANWIPTVMLILVTSVCVRADVVLAWNELLLRAAANASVPVPPSIEARTFAMMHMAMDEAVSSVEGERGEMVAQVAAQRAAAVSAAHAVLLRLLPDGVKVFDALARRHSRWAGQAAWNRGRKACRRPDPCSARK